MFGLTAEKLIVVALVAALIIGPHRLPAYAERLASTIRAIRLFVQSARTAAEREMGATLDASEWRSLDPRQYDPRRIIRDALAEDADRQDGDRQHDSRDDDVQRWAEPSRGHGLEPGLEPGLATSIDDPEDPSPTDVPSEPRRQRRVMVGTSAHPRWILVEVDDEHEREPSAEESPSDGVRVPSTAGVGAV